MFGFDPYDEVVGFVGRLHDEHKGCLDFVDVVGHLPKHYKGLVIGSGPDEAAMRARAEILGLEGRIVFAGLLNQTVDAYHAMSVFCFLSRYEAFGLTIAEAMACEIPVVGFECPGGT